MLNKEIQVHLLDFLRDIDDLKHYRKEMEGFISKNFYTDEKYLRINTYKEPKYSSVRKDTAVGGWW